MMIIITIMMTDAVSCYVELHGYGYGDRQLPVDGYTSVALNGVTHDNVTFGRGIYIYSVEPSSCSAGDDHHFETFLYDTASPELIGYLQALANGKF